MTLRRKISESALLGSAILGCGCIFGQTANGVPQPLSRIVLPVDETKLVVLRGNTHPQAKPEFDKGRVDPQLTMNRMLLVLQRSPEQEAALEAFMQRQLDPATADFHHWVRPEEFGALYGPSDLDVQILTAWLQSHGFTVDRVSKGRTFVEFSGTAALVQQAFHTEIHRYLVKGEEHISNNSDPSIPEALSPIVAGIFSLNDFLSRPLHRYMGNFRRDPRTGGWIPEDESIVAKSLFGVLVTGGTVEMVSPYDFATIYNVAPLWTAGIDGTGQTIAIAGRSDINLTDVANFRAAFGLPANVPNIIVNGPDPGVPSAGDQTENTLDVEWSGGVAKGATIDFVTSKSTTTGGETLSAIYIVDNVVAPVMSFSYGNCEFNMGNAGNSGINALWQQGAAEGISEFVASGDSGAAACDPQPNSTPPYGAIDGLAVSGTSSTPYDIAVGGTDLNWVNNTGTTYWNSTNSGTNLSNALSYIPEVPWNGTCVSDAWDKYVGATAMNLDEEQTCQYLLNHGTLLSYVDVSGGTGGVSACTAPTGSTPSTCAGGWPKPAWQTGTGVPADSKRDVPDVSLFASSGELSSMYVICDSQSTPCTYSIANDAVAQGVGGTSVASPAMAGIMALVDQKMGSPQGNANAGFYALAARDTRANCNTNTVGSGNTCNFYDITTDNNAVPCVPTAQYPASLNCTVHHAGDTVGVLNGNTSTVGYDLTTGLGSVNANNLVNNWHLIAGSTLIPVVSTGAAGNVTTSTASLAGTVNPEGTATQYYFLYGTSSTLSGASQTSMQAAGSGTTAVAAGANLTGLTLNTTYYYQLWASNGAGSSAGAINSFKTLAMVPVPTVSTGAATSVTSTTATLNGTVNPNGASTNVSFLYGTSSTLAGASSTPTQNIGSGGTAQAVNANISGLVPNTTYYYQVQGTNSAGTANGAINSFSTPACASPNPNPNPDAVVAPGDFNGDCRSDILWRNSTTGEVYTWFMNGTTIASQGSPGGVSSNWVVQGAGDFNGDGDADILWRNSTTGEVYIWLLNGTSIASQGSLGSVSSNWTIQGVGDFNGDGKGDILWRNSTTGEVYIWLMNGTTITSGGTLGVVSSNWVIRGIGDYNGDGKADILWRNSTTGEAYIWLMNGTTTAGQGSLGIVSSDWQIAPI